MKAKKTSDPDSFLHLCWRESNTLQTKGSTWEGIFQFLKIQKPQTVMNKQTKLSTLIECGECQLWMMHSFSGTRKTSSHWASLPTPLPRTCRLASVICLRPYIMVLGEQNCLQKEKKQFYFAGQKQALHRSEMGKGEGWWIQTLQM